MKNKILQIFLIIFSFCATCVSCKKEVHVTGVKVNPETLSLNIGDSKLLTTTVSPAKATNKQVIFSSSNFLVASVLPNGLVTGISAGTAVIVVSTLDGGFTASCTVKVSEVVIEDVPVERVTLNKKTLSLGVGETVLLIANIIPQNATIKTVTWSTSNPPVATVINGSVTGLRTGKANIIVTTDDGNKTDTCAIEVINKVYVTGVELNKSELTLGVGDTITLIARVLPYYATNKKVTWKSSNPAVASVNENGFITAKSDGDATITVITQESGYTADCKLKCITVTTPVLTTLEATNISYTSATLGGSITNAGNPAYTERGICYSYLISVPTVDQGGCNEVTVPGSGIENFTTTVSYLNEGAKYYARAYVETELGVTYGNVINFTTNSHANYPALTTLAATNVSYTSAKLGGNITNAGNPAYTERGICYSSVVSVPVVDQANCTKVTVSGSGTGNFTTTVNNLNEGVKYYVRAYVKTTSGITYGNVINFTTDAHTFVRFRKTAAYDYVTQMAVKNYGGTILAQYNFGTNAGTSPYYEISPGWYYPMYYYTYPGNEGWYDCLTSGTYNFQSGHKYTVTCSDDGTYLTFYVVVDSKSANSDIPEEGNTTKIQIPKNRINFIEKPNATISK